MTATNQSLIGWARLGRQASALFLCLGVVLILGGCQIDSIFTKTRPEVAFNTGPKLPSAALPRYVVGESFTYDDKRTDTVIAVQGNLVTWRTDQGIILKQYNNFLIPPLSWQNRTRRSRANITAKPAMLWPLKIGNEERFDIKQVIGRNDGSAIQELERSWQCVVEGTEKITIASGSFDTYRIVCFRYTFDTNFWRQTRTYFYAPSVRHYVIRDDIYVSRPGKRRELISAGFDSTALPESDQATLIQAFQNAMDKNRDGVRSAWRSGDGKISATLTPKRAFRDVTGIICRDYISAYNLGNRTRTNIKRACRQSDGRWQRVPLNPINR